MEKNGLNLQNHGQFTIQKGERLKITIDQKTGEYQVNHGLSMSLLQERMIR